LSARESSAIVAQFQDGQHPVLVASLSSASEGITLTRAQAVAFAELPWTSARFQQAIGRAYGRLNDAHGVNVYVSNGGYIDNSIIHLLLEKDRMANMVQTGDDTSMLTTLLEKSNVLSMLGSDTAP
jgi:ERCC4-related helicase